MTFCMSTTGTRRPTTVTVSSSAPTFRSAFTVAVNVAGSSIPSRLTVEKPGSVKVTVYVPGRRSTILYWPCASVVTVRTRSISAGLLASTVTPGITAPVVSFTTPAIPVACANVDAWGDQKAESGQAEQTDISPHRDLLGRIDGYTSVLRASTQGPNCEKTVTVARNPTDSWRSPRQRCR